MNKSEQNEYTFTIISDWNVCKIRFAFKSITLFEELLSTTSPYTQELFDCS